MTRLVLQSQVWPCGFEPMTEIYKQLEILVVIKSAINILELQPQLHSDYGVRYDVLSHLDRGPVCWILWQLAVRLQIPTNLFSIISALSCLY